MQAIRKSSSLAHQPQALPGASGAETSSPQRGASAVSGTSLRAVRPTVSEAAALARGESLVDVAKVEGLRFEVDIGIWRADSERIAWSVIDDGEYVIDDGEYAVDDGTEDE
jgi:anti-sigma28 factor (negative regulator of flagellin synthesis)